MSGDGHSRDMRLKKEFIAHFDREAGRLEFPDLNSAPPPQETPEPAAAVGGQEKEKLRANIAFGSNSRVAPVRFGSATVCARDGSNGSGFWL